MPPSNNTPATATVITEFPYTNTQSDIHDGGTTYDVWYKYTADGTEGVIGEMFRGAGGYAPSVTVYIDDEFTALGSIAANRMSQTPLIAGRVYLWEVVTNGGNPTPAVLTISIVKQDNDDAITGDIFIRAASILPSFQNAGYTGLGAAIINDDTGIIKNFEPQFIVGESGDYMPTTGELLFADEYTSPYNEWHLFNSELVLIDTIVQSFTGTPLIRTWREGRKFLCFVPETGVDDNYFFTVTEEGVQSAVTTMTGTSPGASAAAFDVDGTHMYIAGVGGSLNSNIKVWNIAGAIYDADFAAIETDYIIQDILVMADGKVIAMYHKASTDSIFVRIYDSAGALLNTYTAPAVAYTSVAPRLGYANDASLSFWLFLHQTDGYSRFINVQVSDISVLKNITTPSSDYFDSDRGTDPEFQLVSSDSCPFTLILTPDSSGIYFINPEITHDIYYDSERKIPNPTIRTALIGE